jgi:hypothetical protein
MKALLCMVICQAFVESQRYQCALRRKVQLMLSVKVHVIDQLKEYQEKVCKLFGKGLMKRAVVESVQAAGIS